MDDETFGSIIDLAVEKLPNEFKKKIENVAIVISDWPTQNQLVSLNLNPKNITLFGLYEGIPKTKRRYYGVGTTLPDKITIFKYPLLRNSSTFNEAIENIQNTVIHELAHHFGMSDDDIHKAKIKNSSSN